MEGRGEAGVKGVVVVRAGDRTEDPIACASIAENDLADQLLLDNAAVMREMRTLQTPFSLLDVLDPTPGLHYSVGLENAGYAWVGIADRLDNARDSAARDKLMRDREGALG